MPLVMLEVPNLQEKVELLDMYYRLGSAAAVVCHFTVNEFSIRTIIKKKICEAITVPVPAGMKILHIL